jgi:hypothetical protein
MKPKLKPPGTKRLTLKCDEPLSSFAFKLNLRRYIAAADGVSAAARHDVRNGRSAAAAGVRAGSLGKAVQVHPIKPTLKAPGAKRLKLKCDALLSKCAFNFSLRHYSTVELARSGPACLGAAATFAEAGPATNSLLSLTCLMVQRAQSGSKCTSEPVHTRRIINFGLATRLLFISTVPAVSYLEPLVAIPSQNLEYAGNSARKRTACLTLRGGGRERARHGAAAADRDAPARARGRAVQVDPMKPTLKASGSLEISA